MTKRQILQLAVGLVQAQAVRNGGVDLQRFGRNASPLAARHVRQRAHVVRAIRQLDEDDAHIARHGQQHLAKRLGLVLLARVELQLVKFRQAVDQLCHRGAKTVYQIRLGNAAVLHGIVQQRRHERLHIQLPAGAQGRHGDRMRDIGLAAVAQLTQVRGVGIAVGLAHLLNAGTVEIVELFQQRGKAGRGRIGHRR